MSLFLTWINIAGLIPFNPSFLAPSYASLSSLNFSKAIFRIFSSSYSLDSEIEIEIPLLYIRFF
ncbi:hypothetical protein VY93_03715 [Mycoplasmopsis synoviae ATCC 25204]|nr:hypothetical protein VY93_03715 [Mycoplasmopsis synoviae ATCC 25204]